MGSVSELRAGFSAHTYSAAKAAVIHLTRCVAVELGEQGIRVNSISPGPIVTGIFVKAAGHSDAAVDRAAGRTWSTARGPRGIGNVAAVAITLGDLEDFHIDRARVAWLPARIRVHRFQMDEPRALVEAAGRVVGRVAGVGGERLDLQQRDVVRP